MPLGACAEDWAPGPTVSVSSVMGESDPSDVGEVLRDGVEEMHREGSERERHVMHHAAVQRSEMQHLW